MNGEIRSIRGIVLRTTESGAGGRRISVFTEETGMSCFFISRGLISRYGAGGLLPLCRVRITVAFSHQTAVVTQYEGQPLFDMLNITYEELRQWSYLIEIVQLFFPEGERDSHVYSILCRAAETAAVKNPSVTAFTAVVQILCAAGYDPSGKETAREMALSEEAHSLICALVCYSWIGAPAMTIHSDVFRESALFLDRFLEKVCDVKLRTSGAFSI